ncbi:neuropeptide CCHamide-1 receptor-like [Chrysoperla carnea]|uniref:neuropeptide CCHamide-1 receptor-like n=1 Tax=Chrysoperla carnea TaxID=189513 RepID=UPI001D08E862|nr:neuropeptide CCHamide-1 receptor-like [Chrysoperla carnea]
MDCLTNNVNNTLLLLNNENSLTSTLLPYRSYKERPETYIVPVIFFIIFVVGVLGNGTLVIVFIRNRAMRNAPNTYILCLALGDLLVILTSVPFTSTVYTVDTWPFGLLVCKMSESAKDISIGVSVFTLTALSADRFFAIVDPLKRLHTSGVLGGTRCAKRVPIIVSIIIWSLSIVFALPGAFGSFLKQIEYPTKIIEVCYPFPDEWGPNYPKIVVLLRFLIYYAIPLTIIGIFYALIARHLILSVHNVPGEMQGAHRQVRARRKVAVTVLAFVVVFAICFLPYHIFMLWFYFHPNSSNDYNAFWHYLRIIGFCLNFLNSCANPVALYCVSGAFRKHFNRYLLCRNRQNVRSRSTTNTYRRANSMSLTMSRINNQQSIHAGICGAGGGAGGGGVGMGGVGIGYGRKSPLQQDQQQQQCIMMTTTTTNGGAGCTNGDGKTSLKCSNSHHSHLHHHHSHHHHSHHGHRHHRHHCCANENGTGNTMTTAIQEMSVQLQ